MNTLAHKSHFIEPNSGLLAEHTVKPIYGYSVAVKESVAFIEKYQERRMGSSYSKGLISPKFSRKGF